MYREPIDIRQGFIQLAGKPGLGLELDGAFIRRHGV